jgi:hypothetical protein
MYKSVLDFVLRSDQQFVTPLASPYDTCVKEQPITFQRFSWLIETTLRVYFPEIEIVCSSFCNPGVYKGEWQDEHGFPDATALLRQNQFWSSSLKVIR